MSTWSVFIKLIYHTSLTWVCPHTAPSCIREQPGCPAGSGSCGRWTGTGRCTSCCLEDAAAHSVASVAPPWQPWICDWSGPRVLPGGGEADNPDRTFSRPAGVRQTFWTWGTSYRYFERELVQMLTFCMGGFWIWSCHFDITFLLILQNS